MVFVMHRDECVWLIVRCELGFEGFHEFFDDV